MAAEASEERQAIDPVFKQMMEEKFSSYDANCQTEYEVRPQLTKEVLTMAGVTSRLSRKDLKFMADDIGRDLVAVMDPKDVLEVMNPKDVLEGMDPEKQRHLLSLLSPEDRLADMSIEELLKGISPEKQKALWDFLLKTHSAQTTDET